MTAKSPPAWWPRALWGILAAGLLGVILLAVLSPRSERRTSLPDLGPAPSFRFATHRGDTLSSLQMEGKVWVAGNRFLIVGSRNETLHARHMSSAEALGLPVSRGTAVRGAKSGRTATGILLRNTEDSDTSVSYSLGRYSFSMEPGFSQSLDPEREWRIRFDRAGGSASYSLAEGTYTFKREPDGWQLYRSTFNIVIDNTDNPNEFHYTADGQQHTLAPRELQTHRTDYPLIVAFDSGNGSRQLTKQITAGGTYRVAVNLAGHHWDLFPEAPPDSDGSELLSPGELFSP